MITYRDVEIEAFGLEKTRGENRERFWTFKVRLSDSPAGSMSADEAVAVRFDHRELRKKIAKLDRPSLKRSRSGCVWSRAGGRSDAG